jgi:hypothetical protein
MAREMVWVSIELFGRPVLVQFLPDQIELA